MKGDYRLKGREKLTTDCTDDTMGGEVVRLLGMNIFVSRVVSAFPISFRGHLCNLWNLWFGIRSLG